MVKDVYVKESKYFMKGQINKDVVVLYVAFALLLYLVVVALPVILQKGALIGTVDFILSYNNPSVLDVSYPCGNLEGRTIGINNFPDNMHASAVSTIRISSQINGMSRTFSQFIAERQFIS